MGLWSQMKTWFVLHLLLGYIFVMTGLIVSFLMLCSCVIWPFNERLYRRINAHLAYSFWTQYTFYGQWWSGSECIVYMDPEDYKKLGREHSLVVMNHKYEVDWVVTMILAERLGMLGGTKVYAKNMLRYLPLMGWVWYFTESIFLKRKWDEDRITLKEDLKNVTDYPDNYWVTLLLFPEGTRFTEKKLQRSLEVSRARGYADMKYHLLPRPKGFILSIQGLKGNVSAVLDLTIAFEHPEGEEPNFMSIVNGRPFLSHVNARRFNLEDIPAETDEECSKWLRELFVQKDDIFEGFVKNKKFEGKGRIIPKRISDLIMWFFWAVVTCVPLFTYIWKLFISGSLTQQLVFIGIIVTASIIIRLMIGVTEIKKEPSRGKNKTL